MSYILRLELSDDFRVLAKILFQDILKSIYLVFNIKLGLLKVCIYFSQFYVCVPTCLHMHQVCAMTEATRIGRQIPWNLNYRKLWASWYTWWEQHLGPFQEQQDSFTVWVISPAANLVFSYNYLMINLIISDKLLLQHRK